MFTRFQDIEETWKWMFKSCMDFLERAKMVRIDDSEEWETARIPLKDAELLQRIGVL